MLTTRRIVLSLLFASIIVLASQPAASQSVIATIPIGSVDLIANPVIALNPATNKIYVLASPGVVVIDGATNHTATVDVAPLPLAIAVNPVTNKIYVAGETMTVIDGTTNQTTSIAGAFGSALAINPVTNKIYVVDGGTDLFVIDGATNMIKTHISNILPNDDVVLVNPTTNRVYIRNNASSLTVIDGTIDEIIAVVPIVSAGPVAINTVTDKLYFATGTGHQNGVTVVDGTTYQTSFVSLGTQVGIQELAVNQVTNQIWAYAGDSNNDMVILDGTTDAITTVPLSALVSPNGMAINPITNFAYTVNNDVPGVVNVVSGSTDSSTTLGVGERPFGLAVNPATNRIYVVNDSDTVSVIAGAGNPAPLRYVPITPCREVDTRTGNGGMLAANTSRNFALQGTCGIPATALAYALNVTVVPPGPLGFLTVWPTGLDQPVSSTLNSLDGRIKANAAIVQAGFNGEVSVFANNATQVILDINGYFVAATDPDALQFYPMTPCRVVDTRTGTGPLAGPGLTANVARDFPILTSTCNIPHTARAYSLNFTAVPPAPLGFITAWPSDQTRPTASTLNDLTGTIVANAAIVPGASDGNVSVYANNNTQLVIDIDGYFAPPSDSGLSFYATQPCRALDTRKSGGQFNGQVTVNVAGSPCVPPTTAQAYVLNATVVPPGPMGFLTLWANGETRPTASTLNALDGAITSNMAIVPTSNGMIDAFANNPTQLILDLAGYFAP